MSLHLDSVFIFGIFISSRVLPELQYFLFCCCARCGALVCYCVALVPSSGYKWSSHLTSALIYSSLFPRCLSTPIVMETFHSNKRWCYKKQTHGYWIQYQGWEKVPFWEKGKRKEGEKTRSLFRGITGVMRKCNGLLTGTSLRKNALTQSHFSGAVAIIAQRAWNQRDGSVKSLVHCLGSIILNICLVISHPVIALCSCCQFLSPSFKHSGIPRAKRPVIKDQTSCPTYITDPSNVYCIALHFLVWRTCLYCAGNTIWFLSVIKLESISGNF